jgi:uncharacterized protein
MEWERSELAPLITEDSGSYSLSCVTVMPDNAEPEGETMAAKFEISKDHAGKFRFHLKAPNGEIIAASQGYETKASAEKGVEAVKTHAPGATVEGPLRLAPVSNTHSCGVGVDAWSRGGLALVRTMTEKGGA